MFTVFSSEEILKKHTENCITINGKQAVKMPDKKNNILKFENYHKQLQVPFVIYADFETITKKIDGCGQNKEKSYTEAYQKHEACVYAYKVICFYDDRFTNLLKYTGVRMQPIIFRKTYSKKKNGGKNEKDALRT